MKTFWLLLSDGTERKKKKKPFQFDSNNLSIRERSLSGPSDGEVMPLILTLIMFSICLSAKGDGWLWEEEQHRTRVRSNLKIDSELNMCSSVISDHMNIQLLFIDET